MWFTVRFVVSNRGLEMPQLVKDRCYYRFLGDRDLHEAAAWSDDPLVDVLLDKWLDAKHAYSDSHAEEINALEHELADKEMEIDRLLERIEQLETQLDDKKED